MKKTILLFVLLCVSFYGFSQDAKYGVRTGYNISNLDFDGAPINENKHRNGFMIGFFGEYFLSKTIALAPELQFSAEGAKREAFKLDYIQLPVMFKFRISERFALAAGPQAGVKVHKTEDGIKNFAYSGVAGVEIKISHQFFADARYTYGFTNIFEDYIPAEAINTNIQLGFGFKF
jgi:opacity protein-like surface antigen